VELDARRSTSARLENHMKLGSQEHHDLMEMFEREHRGEFRLDREPKNIWPIGRIYQNGEANIAFLAYRKGYAFGRAVHKEPAMTNQPDMGTTNE
jgi:hypothetical protein